MAAFRQNAPKQFLNLNQDNSLFQETIIRNIPFCDEFVIVTNQEYQEIVEGQMNQFQGISYQILWRRRPWYGTGGIQGEFCHCQRREWY